MIDARLPHTLLLLPVLLMLTACAGVQKEDLEQTEQSIRRDLNNKIESRYNTLGTKINDLRESVQSVEGKILALKKLKSQVSSKLEEVDQTIATMNRIAESAQKESRQAQSQLLSVLKSEQRVLSEQLKFMQTLIADLERKMEEGTSKKKDQPSGDAPESTNEASSDASSESTNKEKDGEPSE